MKIDVTQFIKNFKGEKIENFDVEVVDGKQVVKKVAMNLRDSITSLLDQENEANRLSKEKKNKAYQIQQKLWSNKVVDLTDDDRSYIKERAAIFWPPMSYGRLSDLFESKDKKESK